MPPGSSPTGPSASAGDGREQARELGAEITAERQRAGKTIEQVAEATRIRATLVRAIEAGDFAPCGGHVYARGHLRAIATALGVDGTPYLEAYDHFSGQTDTVVRNASDEDRVAADPMALRGLGNGERRRAASGWLIAAVAAAAILAIGIGVSVVRGGGDGNATATPPRPSTSVSTPGGTPTTSAPAPSTSQTLAYAGVNVIVNVHDGSSWVHASDETGATVFQGTLTAGMSKEFHAAQRLKFVFGYARAINLTVNGKEIGQPPVGASEVSTVSIDANTATSGQLG